MQPHSRLMGAFSPLPAADGVDLRVVPFPSTAPALCGLWGRWMQRQQEEGAPLCPHPTCPTHGTRIATSSHKPPQCTRSRRVGTSLRVTPSDPTDPIGQDGAGTPHAVVAGGSFIPGGHQEEKRAPSPRMSLRCGGAGRLPPVAGTGCPDRPALRRPYLPRTQHGERGAWREASVAQL